MQGYRVIDEHMLYINGQTPAHTYIYIHVCVCAPIDGHRCANSQMAIYIYIDTCEYIYVYTWIGRHIDI